MGETAFDQPKSEASTEATHRKGPLRFLHPRDLWKKKEEAHLQEIAQIAERSGLKPEVKKIVREARQRASSEVAGNVIEDSLSPAAIALAVVSLVASFGLPTIWLPGPSRIEGWLGAIAVGLGLSTVAVLVGVLIFLAWEKMETLGWIEGTERDVFVAFLIIAGLGIAACVDIERSGIRFPFASGAFLEYAATAAALFVATLVLSLVVVFVVLGAVHSGLSRSSLSQNPRSVFVVSLVNALKELHEMADLEERWRFLEPIPEVPYLDTVYRRRALAALERAAIAAEHYVPKSLTAVDAATALWLRRQGDGVASGVRFHKRSILQGGAVDEVQEYIRKTVVSAVEDRWEEIERRPSSQVSGSSRVRLFLVTALRACLPIGALLALQGTGLVDVQGALSDYLLIATGAWLVLTFLAQYDPLFSAKIGSALGAARSGGPLR